MISASVRRDNARGYSGTRYLPVVTGAAMVALLALVPAQAFIQRPADRELAATRATVATAAAEAAVAVLSYRPESVEGDLAAARSHLTGEFLESYTALADDVVAPTAKEKRVAMQATVVGSAVESATDDSAAVVVYINQAATLADNATPSLTQNVIRVGLVRAEGRWLIERFDPLF